MNVTMLDERHTQVSGTALLPPNAEPMFPADLRQDETVVVHPPVPPWKPKDAAELVAMGSDPALEDTRYWVLRDMYQRPKGPPNPWLNESQPMASHGAGKGFAGCPSVCVWQFRFRDQALGRFPDYLDWGGRFSIVSPRLLALLRACDAQAVVIHPMHLVDMAGALVSDAYTMVDVVRIVRAVDYANSVVRYHGPVDHAGATQPAWVAGWPSVRLLDGAAEGSTIFRQYTPSVPSGIMVPRAFKLAIEEMRPKVTNIAFQSLASGLA